MTDPIADMLTRIRNAQAVNKAEVLVPFSKMKLAMAQILKESGYIMDVERVKSPLNASLEQIKLVLKYRKPNVPGILGITRVSKPSRRVYVSKNELPNVLNNLGIAILSTSQGLMTNQEARKRNLGGEVICEIY